MVGLMQLFGAGEGGIKTIIQWVVFIGLFMFVLPKLYFYQIFAKIEASAQKLEGIAKKGRAS